MNNREMCFTNSFINGITNLTGLPLEKVQQYARENNPFNILEHPHIMEPDEKQLERIGLLNEFISSYNILKIHEDENKIRLSSADLAGPYFSALLGGKKDKEIFVVAFLDTKNNIIQTKIMSEGGISHSIVYPRDILKEAIACDCKSMILAHNHPSGSILLSKEDRAITQKLVNIFHPLDIKILDHIIVGGAKYCSMANDGYMPNDTTEIANYEPLKVDDTVLEDMKCYYKYIEDNELEDEDEDEFEL